MSTGRLSFFCCIAVGLSIGLIKTLFPTVYDLIGSSCLVLVGLCLSAVSLIFCVIPYMQCCHSPSDKLEIGSILVTNKELGSSDFPPTYEESELDCTSKRERNPGKASVIDSVTVDISHTEESPAQVKKYPSPFTPIY